MQNRAKRVKYLRALEKVFNRFAQALKKENFSEDIFKNSVEQNLKFLNKCEAVQLDSPYYKDLEDFINQCCFSKINKEELVARINSLEKLKNQSQYKKEKHKNKIFEY